MDLSKWHIARSISADEFATLGRVNAHFERIKELKGKQAKIRFYMTFSVLVVSVVSFLPFNYTYRSIPANARSSGIGIAILLSWLTICLSAMLLAFLGGWLIGWRRYYKEIGTETEQIFQIFSETPAEFLAALDLIETLEPGTVRLADRFVQRMFKNYKAGKEKSAISQLAS